MGIVLVLFGPKRLPELGNTLGKAIKNFKDALTGVEEASYRRLHEGEGLEQKKEIPKEQLKNQETMASTSEPDPSYKNQS